MSPPHRQREDGPAYPVDTSRFNLAAALGLLSTRLSKPLLRGFQQTMASDTSSKAVVVKRSDVLRRGVVVLVAPLTLLTAVGEGGAIVDNAQKPFVETASGLKVHIAG